MCWDHVCVCECFVSGVYFVCVSAVPICVLLMFHACRCVCGFVLGMCLVSVAEGLNDGWIVDR